MSDRFFIRYATNEEIGCISIATHIHFNGL